MTDQKIIITGANGFIGSALVKHFQKKGWNVIALVHVLPKKPLDEVVYVSYDLTNEPPEGAFEDADVLIHCAYIRNDFLKNVKGTKVLLEQSRKHGLKKNIFLSSFSAHEDAVTKYGKQKLELERSFSGEGDVNIRAGIVLGEGGLFGEMREHIKKGKRVPLIDGGTQPMQSIHVDDLVMIIDKVVDKNISGTFTVAEEEPISYKLFFTAIFQKLDLKPKFIRVPFGLINFALSITEALHIPMPVAKENVLGLKFIKFRETKKDLEKLGVKVRSFNESLKAL